MGLGFRGSRVLGLGWFRGLRFRGFRVKINGWGGLGFVFRV